MLLNIHICDNELVTKQVVSSHRLIPPSCQRQLHMEEKHFDVWPAGRLFGFGIEVRSTSSLRYGPRII